MVMAKDISTKFLPCLRWKRKNSSKNAREVKKKKKDKINIITFEICSGRLMHTDRDPCSNIYKIHTKFRGALKITLKTLQYGQGRLNTLLEGTAQTTVYVAVISII